MKIEYRPIGIVHSPYDDRKTAPKQPCRAPKVRGTVEVFAEYAEGLRDLDGFSHIVLLCHLHQSTSYRLRLVPYLETELRGLFATRSPNRPNPIGLSVLELVGIADNLLTVEGLDFLNGTPVLDIKPYICGLDDRHDVREGWLAAARRANSAEL